MYKLKKGKLLKELVMNISQEMPLPGWNLIFTACLKNPQKCKYSLYEYLFLFSYFKHSLYNLLFQPVETNIVNLVNLKRVKIKTVKNIPFLWQYGIMLLNIDFDHKKLTLHNSSTRQVRLMCICKSLSSSQFFEPYLYMWELKGLWLSLLSYSIEYMIILWNRPHSCEQAYLIQKLSLYIVSINS